MMEQDAEKRAKWALLREQGSTPLKRHTKFFYSRDITSVHKCKKKNIYS